MALLPFSQFSREIPADVKVYFWSLDETVDELSGMLSHSLLLQTPPFIDFKSVKRRQEWLAVRVLLQQVCERPVEIHYEKTGKPYLTPRLAEFSISHTKGVVSIALSQRPLGIDVEQIGPRPLYLQEHFMQPGEFDFSSVSFPELMAVYLWSAKESVYKLVDLPGTELKADIHLSSVSGDQTYVELTARVSRLDRLINVRCYLMSDFVLTIATYQTSPQS